MIAKMQQYRHW